MLNVKVIKVKKLIRDKIEQLLTSNNFGWFYNPTTIYDTKNIRKLKFSENKFDEKDTWQFTHKFYDELYNTSSYYYENALDLFHATKIKYEKFLRIKANFTVPSLQLEKHHQFIHRDVKKDNITTFLYYVNDSDGDTIFFDDNEKETKRFKPKKGTGLLFKSNILHAGSNPVKYDKRMVINYNFYE